MRDWIAGATAVLGVLLVLAGGTLKVLSALAASRTGGDEPAPETPTGDSWPAPPGAADSETTAAVPAVQRRQRGFVVVRAVRRLPEADGLIAWGIMLLLLGAIAAGAISFNFGADAGTR